MNTDDKLPKKPVESGKEHGDFAAGERTSTVDETGTDFAEGERTLPKDPNAQPDFAAGERTMPKDPNAHPDFARGEDKE
jgi:hypothetical protein